ncbi:MAG TPA: sensor histidine kinase [Candidatus Acidoferrales bacterium]
MPLDTAERLYLDRQVTLARAIFVALALVDLIEISVAGSRTAATIFLAVYLPLALAVLGYERLSSETNFTIPLLADCVALAVFLFLTPSLSAWWFLFLFVVFALATQGNARLMLALVSVATAGIIFRVAVMELSGWRGVWHWLTIGLGTVISGLGMGFLGAREREHLERQQFLEKVSRLLQFDRGLTESVRQALGEIALEFECEQACLAIRDEELERLFVWKIHPNDREIGGPETLPLSRSDTFLTDAFETSFCWEFNDGAGTGFGWDRRSGQVFRDLPAPPNSTREEFGARTLLAVTIEAGGRPTGRVLLINPDGPGGSNGSTGTAGLNGAQGSRRRFTRGELRWLERIVRHVGPPLENVFLMRHLRARAVESERSRISRDLHDGILQTLLSLNIQLDVLRHKFPWTPEQAGKELETLQKTVQQESEELRRMVTDLRPLRVESADMRELMLGFAERFRNEAAMAVDLFIEDRNLRLPDRICRELFQIYRESLNNIKKHAKASHVVVKLGQDEAKVSLVVDDNGRGFSFSGRYSSEELDRLRLGPISIKERTRGVGGTLTVESNPGHGARLTVEIPLN